MKKGRIIILGKDELNLCECPFTLLTDRVGGNQKTLEFIDRQGDITRHWTITGSNTYGLPLALDEEVYIGMAALTKEDGFKSKRVYFNPYEMLKLMRWPDTPQYYDRLEMAIKRLHGTSIFTDYLWDAGGFKEHSKSIGFHILEEFELNKGVKGSKRSWFQWGSRIFESLQSGNIKTLDLQVYFSLRSILSKRFYRFWDKRLHKIDRASFLLEELCFEKLGINRNTKYFSEMKRRLAAVLKEHKTKRLLSVTEYKKDKKSGKWYLVIERYTKKPTVTPGGEGRSGALTNQLVSLGIAEKTAKILVRDVDNQIIIDQIRALPYRNFTDKPAFLIKAIRENFPLPAQIRKEKNSLAMDNEADLRKQYREYLIREVDQCLAKVDQKQLELEILEHRDVFLRKYPHYEDLRESDSLNDLIEEDYKREKALDLGVIGFDEWRKFTTT